MGSVRLPHHIQIRTMGHRRWGSGEDSIAGSAVGNTQETDLSAPCIFFIDVKMDAQRAKRSILVSQGSF